MRRTRDFAHLGLGLVHFVTLMLLATSLRATPSPPGYESHSAFLNTVTDDWNSHPHGCSGHSTTDCTTSESGGTSTGDGVTQMKVIEWDYTAEAFAQQVVARGEPVVIKNAPPSQWAAVTEWSSDRLREILGAGEFPRVWQQPTPTFIHFDAEDEMNVWNGVDMKQSYSFTETAETVGAFFDAVAADEALQEGNTGDRNYCYTGCPVGQFGSLLERDVSPYGDLVVGKDVDFGLFFSSKGLTTRLHYDLQENFFVQLQGRKSFLLLPPSGAAFNYLFPVLHPSFFNCQVDPLNGTQPEQFSRFKARGGVAVTLEPGDVMYLPAFWFHNVYAETTSISASVHSSTKELDEVFATVRDVVRSPLPLSGEAKASCLRAATRVFLAEFVDGLYGAGSSAGFMSLLHGSRYEPMFGDHVYTVDEIAAMCPSLADAALSAECKSGDFDTLAEMFQHQTSPAAQDYAQRYSKIPPSVAYSYLGNYIENVVNTVVGMEGVDLFLRYCF